MFFKIMFYFFVFIILFLALLIGFPLPAPTMLRAEQREKRMLKLKLINKKSFNFAKFAWLPLSPSKTFPAPYRERERE